MMDYKELIEELKGFSYWLGQSGPESHDIHPRVCDKAIAAVETLLTERDAAVEEMHGRCIKCKHFSVGALDYPCTDCRYEGGANDHWQWRGHKPPDREMTER